MTNKNAVIVSLENLGWLERKPLSTGYINWKGTNGQSTDLPELAVPQKEGYIASVEKVPVQATTATDEDYEYVVKYTAIQKAKTTFVDEKGNAIPGVAEITEQGGSETPLTKEAEVKAKIKELENKGYELVSNTYLSLIHISEPTRRTERSRMPSSA